MIFSNSVDSLSTDTVLDDPYLQRKGLLEIKFLSFIGDKFSWKSHIDNVCNTISRNIGVINRSEK